MVDAGIKLPFEPSCAGERYRTEYAPIVNDDGTITLVEDGKTDLQEMYDVQAAGCDMSLIVQRYLSGDYSVLSRAQGVYIDTTVYPKSNAELLQKVIDGQRYFDSLSPDIKSRFDNDFNQWFAGAGSEQWLRNMNVESAKLEKKEEEKL